MMFFEVLKYLIEVQGLTLSQISNESDIDRSYLEKRLKEDAEKTEEDTQIRQLILISKIPSVNTPLPILAHTAISYINPNKSELSPSTERVLQERMSLHEKQKKQDELLNVSINNLESHLEDLRQKEDTQKYAECNEILRYLEEIDLQDNVEVLATLVRGYIASYEKT